MRLLVRREAALGRKALAALVALVHLVVRRRVLFADEFHQLRQLQVVQVRQQLLLRVPNAGRHRLLVLHEQLHLDVDLVERLLLHVGAVLLLRRHHAHQARRQVVDHVHRRFDHLLGEVDVVQIDQDVPVVDFDEEVRLRHDPGELREHDPAAVLLLHVPDELLDLVRVDVALVVLVFNQNQREVRLAPEHEIPARRVRRRVLQGGRGKHLREHAAEHALRILPLELRRGLEFVQELAHLRVQPLARAPAGDQVVLDPGNLAGNVLLVGLDHAEERLLQRAQLRVERGDELADVGVALFQKELLQVALDRLLHQVQLGVHLQRRVLLRFRQQEGHAVHERVGVLAHELHDALAVLGPAGGDDHPQGFQERTVVVGQLGGKVRLQPGHLLPHLLELLQELALRGVLHERRHVLAQMLQKPQQHNVHALEIQAGVLLVKRVDALVGQRHRVFGHDRRKLCTLITLPKV